MRTQVTIDGKTIQIELTEEQINQIKGEMTSNKRWRAERGKEYWAVNTRGNIYQSCDLMWTQDDFRYSQRNYFKTSKEAEQHLEKLKLISEIRDRIEELNEGWTPDWSDADQEKFYIYYTPENNLFQHDYYRTTQFLENWKYLKSKKVVEQLIKEFGDKLKVLFE